MADTTADKLEYWKKRCELAEKYIAESPSDPDLRDAQWKAYQDWQNYIKNVDKP
jgi:hypothetical protein